MRKKIFLFASFAIAAIFVVSCDKTSPKNVGNGLTEVSITASFPEAVSSTKTFLEGKSVNWSAGDSIAVFTETGERFMLGTSQSGSTAVFKGFLPESAKELTAVYPPSVINEFTDGKINVSLPYSQSPVKGGFDSNAAIIVAKGEFAGENTTLSFAQTCGLVRFEVTSDDVKKVDLTSPSGKFIVGSVNIPDDTAAPKIDFGMRTISATPSTGKYFEKGIYYFCVWPINVMSGVTMVFNCDSGDKTAKLPSTFIVERGKIWIVERLTN